MVKCGWKGTGTFQQLCDAPYHGSVQLLGSVVIVVLVPGPVSNMGEKSPAQKYVLYNRQKEEQREGRFTCVWE